MESKLIIEKPIPKIVPFPMADTKLCIKCSKQISNESTYCPYCGKKQDVPLKEYYHPKKKFTVYPIKGDDWIDKMQSYLLFKGSRGAKDFTNRRNYMMFTIGIDVGLRASDLCCLKVSDFLYVNWKPKMQTRLIEKKTGKERDIFFNKALVEAVREYIVQEKFKYDDYIFPSRTHTNGFKEPINVKSLNRIMRDAAKDIGYPLRVGSHSLRKTFGYRIFTEAMKEGEMSAQRALTVLCEIFNHSDVRKTMRYIGITEDEKVKLHNIIASDYSLYENLNDDDEEDDEE